MRRRSWKRTERDGLKPVPDNIVPYRDWCEAKNLDPEDVASWGKWSKKFQIEDYLP
jgi:hypothetical protein